MTMNSPHRSRLLPQVLHPARLVALAALVALVISGAVAPQERVTAAPTATATATATESSGDCTAAGTTPTTTTAQPEYHAMVQPGESRTITYDQAKLVIGPRAVTQPVGIGITPLTGAQLRRLDPGMTNVTAKPRRGYRFTPHPLTFAEEITVSLPYDPALLDPDFTPQDIYTYYFDDTGLCWRPLERVTVDEVNHLVVSLTDHFTDMINATVTVPEHPEGESFDPNEIKGIEAADPADQVPRRAPRAPRGSEPTARAHRIPGVVGTAPGPAPGSFPVGSRPCRDVPGALPGTAGAGLGCRCPQRRRPEVP